jgi:ribosomal protein S12 methylthiotransferase accessory factor
MKIPAFRKSVRVDAIPGEGIIVSHEYGQMAFSGALEEGVASLIDGNRTADDIADMLAGRFPRENIHEALLSMQRQSIAYDKASLNGHPIPSAWHHIAQDLRHAEQAVAQTEISVVATAGLRSGLHLKSFTDYGLRVGKHGAVLVVFTGDYLNEELANINHESLQSGRPWMLVKPTGTSPLVGPIFRPGATACWECLARRLRGQRELERFGGRRHADRLASPAPFESAASAIQAIAAFHTCRWIASGENPLLEGKIISLNLATLVTCTHVVSRHPNCVACGQPASNTPTPPKLDNRSRVASVDTGHRSMSAEQTYAKLQHHLSSITGIVSDLSPVRAQTEEIIKLYMASHNYALGNESLYFLASSMQSKSCGKGMTEAQARTGALCEALERYCGAYTGDEIKLQSSYRALGNKAIHPNACMLFSERQYQQDASQRPVNSVFNHVPARFSCDEEIDWTPVWSFGARDFRYLPTAYLYYGYPSNGKTPACWADSNGNAAGNTLEEAAIHGFFELVERDAVAIWWYNRLRRPGVDLASFEQPYIPKCIDFYARHGRQLWALDLTTDFGISTFAAVSRRIDQPCEEIIFGFGSHLDAKVALTRAIVEMNQFLPIVSGPIGPDGRRIINFQEENAVRWWRTASVAAQPYLVPDASLPLRRAADFPAHPSDDQLVDLMICVTRAQALGMDTLLLDQTRADVEMPVAKIVVPGMRHFWARFAPGRLYDVPCRLGWLPRSLHECELNPIPMFV